jgi:hypothetical protein
MREIYLRQMEILTPGFEGWAALLPYLQGQSFVMPTETTAHFKPQLLPPNERRRATGLTRMVFTLGELFLAGDDAKTAANWQSVFASSGGDYPVVDAICRDLAQNLPISPTQFHNSVHNAVAGYWTIATGAHDISTSLSAYDNSLAAGLFEANLLALTNDTPTFLCAYDVKPPPLIAAVRDVRVDFATALLLSAKPSATDLAKLQVNWQAEGEVSGCLNPDLETLRAANPAARILPLAELIALRRSGECHLAYYEGILSVKVHCV